MPWLIQHRCVGDVAEPEPYAIQLGNRNGEDLTRIACVRRGGCGEEFFILGHEMYREAHATGGLIPARPNLPPGFVIAQTRTPE